MSDAHGVARDQLRAFITRIERLEEEKKTIADDIKDVYGEAKGAGFDTKVLREVIKIRKQDRDERAEREAILDSYLIALGMIDQPSFFDDEPRQSAPVERQPAMALRSDGGLSIVTKHEDIRTSGGSPSVSSSLTTREAEESVVSNPVANAGEEATSTTAAASDDPVSRADEERERQHASTVGFADDCRTGGKEQSDASAAPVGDAAAYAHGIPAIHSEKATVATQDEATEPTRDDGEATGTYAGEDRAAANAGGDHVDGNALRVPTSVTGEGAANTALPDDTALEDWPPSPMKRLPYAHCFPELSRAAYEALQADIMENGFLVPIIRQGDVIVNGWSRYNIARTLGISYPIKNYRGNDVLLDVIEWQRADRNFTPAQEKKIAADLAKEFPSRADEIMAAFGLAEALEAAE